MFREEDDRGKGSFSLNNIKAAHSMWLITVDTISLTPGRGDAYQVSPLESYFPTLISFHPLSFKGRNCAAHTEGKKRYVECEYCPKLFGILLQSSFAYSSSFIYPSNHLLL